MLGVALAGAGRFPKLLAGFENPSGRIWFRRLMVWLVVPDRYCDRDRSTRRRFAAHSVPSPVSEGLEGDIGFVDRDIRFRQPVVDLPIDCESVCAAEGFDLHVHPGKRGPRHDHAGPSFARNQSRGGLTTPLR
jgi:hypothetical protein